MGKDALEKIEIKFVGDSKSLTLAIDKLDKATKKLLNTQAKIVDFNKKQTATSTAHRKTLKQVLSQLKLNNAGFKDLNVSTNTWTKALKGNKFAIARVQSASRKYIATNRKLTTTFEKLNARQIITTKTNKKVNKGFLDTTHSTRILGGSFAVLRSKMLLFNFAMGLGIRQLNKFGKESAKVDSMARAFNTLQGGGNKASVAIEKLRTATNGTMSSFDLFQQANNAMILGVSDNATEMGVLFDVAQRLGHALGKDTKTSVESLVTGLGRQSKLMLDNIGIMMSATTAYQRYADVNNLSVNSLTDTQKKQAFLTETIKVAKEEADRLGIEIVDATMIFQQFDASVANATAELGEAFLPIALTTAKTLTALLNAFDSARITRWGLAIGGATVLFGLYKTSVFKAKIETISFQAMLAKTGWGTVIALGGLTAGVIMELAGAFEDAEDAIDNGTNATKRFNEEAKKTADEEKSSINSLILRLNLLSAQTPLQKELLQLGSDASQMEIDLIKKIVAKEGAIKATQEAEKKQQETFNENLKQGAEDFEKKLKLEQKAQKEAYAIHQQLFANNADWELGQLQDRVDLYREHYGHVLMAEELFEKERQAILDKGLDKVKEIADERKELENILRDNKKLDELEAIDAQAQLMRDAGLNEVAIKQFVADQKTDIDKKYAQSELDKIKESAKGQLDQFKVVLDFGKKITSQLEKNLDSQVTNELEALKKTDAYKKASSEQRKTMETQVNNKFAKERKKLFEYNKGVSMAEAMITIAEKIIEYIDNPLMQIAIGALGAVQLKAISSQKAPTYEQGGLVGGRRHSQGGTMIEAERGEFVMSRSAVGSIGVEAMNQINQGGGAGITVNVTAPLVDETVIDSIIPAIEKAQRLNLA